MTGERILIVENDKAVAKGLTYGLTSAGFEIILAKTGQQALHLATAKKPHIILLDICLPDISGFDVCRQLRDAGNQEPILMLTAGNTKVDKALGRTLGVNDYIVKPYHLRNLISRISIFLTGNYTAITPPPPPAPPANHLSFNSLEIDLEQLVVTKNEEIIDLTPIEFRLLQHLVNNVETPVSRDELVEAVWGYNSDVSNNRTIDVHMRHLRQKLEDNPAKPKLFVTVRGVGYQFNKPD